MGDRGYLEGLGALLAWEAGDRGAWSAREELEGGGWREEEGEGGPKAGWFGRAVEPGTPTVRAARQISHPFFLYIFLILFVFPCQAVCPQGFQGFRVLRGLYARYSTLTRSTGYLYGAITLLTG